MIKFDLQYQLGDPATPVYIDTMWGHRWCEVLGDPSVDRVARGRIIANALALYLNHIYPHTKRGSKAIEGYPQMELLFPEE